MVSREELVAILQESLMLEKQAEDNCELMLQKFRLNGFHDMVAHIENDEVIHQEMVKKLTGFLSE